jgi:hypothetical protein
VPEDKDADQEFPATDAYALGKALELELKLKRAFWAKSRAQRKTWRLLSILFVLLVFFGALLAFFFVLPDLHSRSDQPASATTVSGGR